MMDLSTKAALGAQHLRHFNKVGRAQFGEPLHEAWMKDIIKHCGTKVMYVCDMMHGSGEIMKAAINAKVSEEASTSGVRVMLWGHDPRNVLAEVGRAVTRSQVAHHYLRNKLAVPGLMPPQDPGPKPERSRKLISAMLKDPLKVFSLDSNGHLIIPTEDDMTTSCPVALKPDQLKLFSTWRVEFACHEPVAETTPKRFKPDQTSGISPDDAVVAKVAHGDERGDGDGGDDGGDEHPCFGPGMYVFMYVCLCLCVCSFLAIYASMLLCVYASMYIT